MTSEYTPVGGLRAEVESLRRPVTGFEFAEARCKEIEATLRFTHFAERLPPIEADAAQVRQLVMNLVLNASEAIGSKEGTIVISPGTRHCDEAFLRGRFTAAGMGPGTHVFLEVADTGCGMGANKQAKIFDPFFTTKFTGRDLGPAAVLGIMRSHKGGIKVQSKPGEGATFTVLFPASTQPPQPAGTVAETTSPRGKGTVLLVDDEESVREVAQMILEHCGYRVLPAEDGFEAVKIFQDRAREIDCVLLDLTMPRLDGEETHRELRRLQPGVRVILTSGYSEQELTSRFAGLGLAGFIQKPFEVKTLSDKVREVLSQPPPVGAP